MRTAERLHDERGGMGYVLLWLIGIPIPVLVLLYLFFH